MTKIIDRIPSLLFAAGLGFVSFTAVFLVLSHSVLHTRMWWVLLILPVAGLISIPVVAFVHLRELGLRNFATMGEYRQAVRRQHE
jgi:hypothetical protein